MTNGIDLNCWKNDNNREAFSEITKALHSPPKERTCADITRTPGMIPLA